MNNCDHIDNNFAVAKRPSSVRPSVCLSVCPQFTQNPSSLSVLDRFQFWLFRLIDLITVHNSSSRICEILIFWENMDLFGVKIVEFTQNASSPSILDGFRFWLFCLIDLRTVHNSSSRICKILILWGKIWLFWGENSEFTQNSSSPSILNGFQLGHSVSFQPMARGRPLWKILPKISLVVWLYLDTHAKFKLSSLSGLKLMITQVHQGYGQFAFPAVSVSL